MGLEFVTRVVKTTVVVAIITALFVATYVSPAYGAGVFLGALWNSLNLLVVVSLVKIVIATEKFRKRKVACVVALKFPVLYGVGFFLLWTGLFPVVSLVVGFSLVLAVIILKALGITAAEKLRGKRERSYA
ncbi:MAG: hypothetical protein AMJ46_03045 [Latescibacteria bacterium DG_63]|nr:MAG: hypothetical protein AMJ46_03045 [Latescibacteria bacterium DG_63]